MRVSNTSLRLKEIMEERNIRQVDILTAAKPYCTQYGVKLEKNDLSQYVNGKVEPGQEKLTILGLTLNVSEAWLMGYDVSPSREDFSRELTASSSSGIEESLNVLRIAGRDGSFEERILTDDQLATVKAFLNLLPDASDDL